MKLCAAHRPCRAAELYKPAAVSRSTVNHRMHEQANVESALAKLADHRIQKERHVVVDDIEYRNTRRHVRRNVRGTAAASERGVRCAKNARNRRRSREFLGWWRSGLGGPARKNPRENLRTLGAQHQRAAADLRMIGWCGRPRRGHCLQPMCPLGAPLDSKDLHSRVLARGAHSLQRHL